MNTQPSQKTLKILIIDDELSIVEALEDICEALGYETISTLSCQEGLHLAETRKDLDLIICDLTMQPIDGMQIYWATVTPCILITATVTVETRRLLSHPRIISLEKPFTIDSLVRAINQALS